SATSYVEKFLAMVEYEKAIVKDYTKLVAQIWERLVYYMQTAFIGNGGRASSLKGKGKVHDIQNRLRSLEVDLAREIKAKQVDDHDDDDLDSLDLANRLKKLEEDFGMLLKAKKEKEGKKTNTAKKAREAKKANEAMKAREVEFKAKEAKKAKEEKVKAKKANEAKEVMLVELRRQRRLRRQCLQK
ncbi:hypothetical protein Tco_0543729, partial [Tanacetum coccineum]